MNPAEKEKEKLSLRWPGWSVLIVLDGFWASWLVWLAKIANNQLDLVGDHFNLATLLKKVGWF